MRIYSDSDIGKRRKNNEDNVGVLHISDDIKLLLVADGVAGEEDGEIASEIAIESLKKYVELNFDVEKINNENYFEDLIREALNFSNINIVEKQNENLSKMSTTIVGAFVCNDTAKIFNIGDSRCYLYSNNNLEQITKDHTFVQTLVDANIITKEEARTHNVRNVVTRVLGISYNGEFDYFETKLNKDDVLILCSDGLNSMVKDEEIKNIIANNIANENKIVKNLINTALKNGGYDNITVLCAVDFWE